MTTFKGMATFKNGHFSCNRHGDLGEHDTAIAQRTVLYSGEDQIDGFMCMACLGNEYAQHLVDAQAEAAEAENAKSRTIYVASSVSLFDTSEYEDIKALVERSYPQDTLIFAKGLYSGSQEWLTKWPHIAKTVDVLLAFTHDGWIGRGVFTEMADIYEQGKPVYVVDPQGKQYQLSGIPVEIDHELQVIGSLAFQFDTGNWRKYVSVIIQEPTLAHCPYCNQTHNADQVELCPLKPT